MVAYPRFLEPVQITLNGYSGNASEPDISSDGEWLFYQDGTSGNVSIRWALRVSDTEFTDQGEVASIKSTSFDGTPRITDDNVLYFVSTRLPASGTILQAQINSDPTDVDVPSFTSIIDGPSVPDVHTGPGPARDGSIFFVARQVSGTIERIDVLDPSGSDWIQRSDADADSFLPLVNTENVLEYAPEITSDNLEFWFTRFDSSVSSLSKIFACVREDTTMNFSTPRPVDALNDGFVEAPSLIADGSRVYYHRLVAAQFAIMTAARQTVTATSTSDMEGPVDFQFMPRRKRR